MAWLELNMDATPDAVDWVRSLLMVHDRADLQITQLLGSEPCQNSSNWAYHIRLCLPYDASRAEALSSLLSPLYRTGLISLPEIEVVDEMSQSVSQTHRIGQRFVVLDSDRPYQRQNADEIPLRLLTNLSFGSGLHPATFLSLQLLERYVLPEMKTLDLGSGTGILSVAMAKLGAEVLALDNDQTAVQATQDTVRCNGIGSQVNVRQGSLGQGSELGHWMGGSVSSVPTLQPTAAFNLIVSNILGRVHITLADDYQRALSPISEAILITSGFTTDYESDVNDALSQAGFTPLDCQRWNEWVALAHHLAA